MGSFVQRLITHGNRLHRAVPEERWEKDRPSLADAGSLPQYHLEEVERTAPERRLGIEYSDGFARGV